MKYTDMVSLKLAIIKLITIAIMMMITIIIIKTTIFFHCHY